MEISFSVIDEKVKSSANDINLKIESINAELAKISDERAVAEAAWRKKENFLNTEKGKLQLALRGLVTATVTEA
jgi:hypothetical protein